MSPSADVVVLGAGPAGLAAAWRAALAGAQVTVIDKAPVPGGMAASFDVAGVRVDHGSHRLHPSIDPAILAELQRLLGGDLQRRHRHGRVRFEDRWLDFPLRAGNLLAHLPRRMAARAAFDTGRRLVRRSAGTTKGDGFADAVRAGLGPTVAERFYLPYARKLFALDPDELDGELARRRVGVRTAGALVSRVLETSRGEPPVFWYPRRGYGQIGEVIAEAAVAGGVDLRLGAGAARVELHDDRVAVRLGDDRGITVTGRQLWSTIPTGALARVVAEPAVPAAVRATAHQLGYRAMALVYLVVDRAQYTPFDAHYLPDPSHPVSRLSEPRNYRAGGDDEPDDRTVLCAEVPCDVGDARWHASPAVLGAQVMDALARTGLPRAQPVDVVVKRLPHVYPLYRRGFATHQEALEAWAATLPGVVLFGRQGLFAHDNTHHALAMGWAAADCWSSAGFAWDRWQRARASFRDHVVED